MRSLIRFLTVTTNNKKEYYSISELNDIISEVIKSPLFQNISVLGEITSKSIKNGNVYLTLVDSSSSKKATLKVIIFNWTAQHIFEKYEEGDEIVVTGDLNYYSGFGTLSLIAKSLYNYGEGKELLRLERLKAQLAKEGLFDQSKKKPLPLFPKKIGIITSASGAAYHDIIETLSKKFPVNTLLFDAVVQGSNAPDSLIDALDRAEVSDVDLVIFGRGGGSKTDLACFNDERVVRRVASFKKPLISAIGHEIDVSLCDYASDVMAITPTDAANKCLPDLEDIEGYLIDSERKLDYYLNNYLDSSMLEVINLSKRLDKFDPSHFFEIKAKEVENSSKHLDEMFLKALKDYEYALKEKELKLDNINPYFILEKGYALVNSKDKVISSTKEVKKDDMIEIKLKDGVVYAKVTEVKDHE